MIKILVVDDEKSICDLIDLNLSVLEVGGYNGTGEWRRKEGDKEK